ncbi:hypothetical protein N7474_010140 [Penicillium riverlandense]|uniref:uncharacterized protein n=1 Tax=Penicillium riverlandense TaxID=1903569 RepID=UPI002546629B|nr:uncharacterized protein N7474_010140 [Penicillium riverlandense]KAJ5808871.1 hypothetical protein N7474_010140 [Penicillium riverlandense]
MRLQVGMKDAPPLLTPKNSPILETTANVLLGSYRFLPTAGKRGRVDYTGLDGLSKRRKKKIKDSTTSKDTIRKDKTTRATLEGNTPVARPLTTDIEGPSEACMAASSSFQPTLPLSVCESLPPADCHENAIQVIKQENAFSASKDIQTRSNETVYWEIIKKGAELLDPETLPTPKGPLDEFTVAEKVATERFMREAGYGLSLANQRQCRIFWKRLFEIRKAGVDKILLYRTKEFDRFCKGYTPEAGLSLVEMVRLWEEKYGLHIKQIESRVAQESQGDSTGRLWLSQPHVAERLDIQEHTWNSAGNPWFSSTEEAAFQSNGPHEPSATQLGGFFDLNPGTEGMRNKSIFVTLLPKEENLSVCPIISV